MFFYVAQLLLRKVYQGKFSVIPKVPNPLFILKEDVNQFLCISLVLLVDAIYSQYVMFLQCDLFDMPAVAQLEKDGKYALVYQLLKIFVTQRLDAYFDFHAANSTLLKSYGMLNMFSLGALWSLYLTVSVLQG